MQTQNKFSLLRRFLTALGLSPEAVDDIIVRIEEFLSARDEKAPGETEYPYSTRDPFLSPAEHSFFMVLKTAISDSALISIKVGLRDLFYASCHDGGENRAYTNKIDRKHVDFLLCDPKTVQPLLGIELDDRSHQRSDRQARDAFVENVFRAAGLPLVRIPVKHSYSASELRGLLHPYLVASRQTIRSLKAAAPAPDCPRCGNDMVLRTAKSGANPGEKFWGCSNFPECRGMLKYSGFSD